MPVSSSGSLRSSIWVTDAGGLLLPSAVSVSLLVFSAGSECGGGEDGDPGQGSADPGPGVGWGHRSTSIESLGCDRP